MKQTLKLFIACLIAVSVVLPVYAQKPVLDDSRGQKEGINPTNAEFIDYLTLIFGERLMPHFYQIALAESGDLSVPGSFKQFNDDGSVVSHVNKNGSIDYGIFQCNSSHDEEARKLDLDYKNDWRANVRLARWIFDHQSARAWSSIDRI